MDQNSNTENISPTQENGLSSWSKVEKQKLINIIKSLEDYNWEFISFVMKKPANECMYYWDNFLCFKVLDRPFSERDHRMMVELFYLLNTNWDTIAFVTFRSVYCLQKYYLKNINTNDFHKYVILKHPLELELVDANMKKIIEDYSKLSLSEKRVVFSLARSIIKKN